MTNPNQLCDVLLFVCSKMTDETNLSSKLPVADRTRKVRGRKLCWWCLSSGFPPNTFVLGFADSFCFVFTSSPFYEASPLCRKASKYWATAPNETLRFISVKHKVIGEVNIPVYSYFRLFQPRRIDLLFSFQYHLKRSSHGHYIDTILEENVVRHQNVKLKIYDGKRELANLMSLT